jgi:hypothetical protein
MSSDRLLRLLKDTGDILFSFDLTEVRKFYFLPTLNSVYIFFKKSIKVINTSKDTLKLCDYYIFNILTVNIKIESI